MKSRPGRSLVDHVQDWGRCETNLSPLLLPQHFLGIPTSFTDLAACRYPTCFQSVLVMTLAREIRDWCVNYCR